MAEQLLQVMKWKEVRSDTTYLYGSTIFPGSKSLFFENLSFASGKPIQSWRSRTNYQGNRVSPDLPLLCAGQKYRLKGVLTAHPEGATYFQVRFFNRQQEEIKTVIIKGTEGTFTYPKDAFTYSITLVSGGCSSLRFSHVALYGEPLQTISLQSVRSHRYTAGNHPKDLDFVKILLGNTAVAGEE